MADYSDPYATGGFGAADYGAQPFGVTQPSNRMDWRSPQPIQKWDSLTEEQKDRKMGEMSAGGQLAVDNPAFPDSRPCRDALFGVLFVVLAAGFAGYGLMNLDTVEVLLAQLEAPPYMTLVTGMAMGAAAAFVAAAAYMILMGQMPACVVWVSLIAGPALMISLGVFMMLMIPGTEGLILGGVMIALGVCMLTCVFVCWRVFIPFTIEVVKVLATVMKEYPSMLVTAAGSGGFSLVWSFGVFATALIVAYNYTESNGGEITKDTVQIFSIPFVFAFFWGVMVAYYWSHTVLCGVFGRWYYKKDLGAPLVASVKVASTTSFGSISCAALIVALIRTLEYIISMFKRDAREDGNIAMVIVLSVLECIVRCIGDIVEWFSEWALVQVAVRGTGFFDSAKITFTMATCANVYLILASLLTDSVAFLASLVCASAGAAGGAAWMFISGGNLGLGALLGLLPGIMIGNAAGAAVSSGTKTIVMSWAEDPEELIRHHPEIADQFERKAAGVL